MRNSSQIKKARPSKLAMGLLAAGITAIVGVAGTGVAQAAPADKPTRDSCASSGYSNYGQCVRDWAQERAHGGNGYGGNVDVGLDLDVNGDGNIINIIVNVIFGR